MNAQIRLRSAEYDRAYQVIIIHKETKELKTGKHNRNVRIYIKKNRSNRYIIYELYTILPRAIDTSLMFEYTTIYLHVDINIHRMLNQLPMYI